MWNTTVVVKSSNIFWRIWASTGVSKYLLLSSFSTLIFSPGTNTTSGYCEQNSLRDIGSPSNGITCQNSLLCNIHKLFQRHIVVRGHIVVIRNLKDKLLIIRMVCKAGNLHIIIPIEFEAILEGERPYSFPYRN